MKKDGISLKSLFREIKKQTGYDIIYADKILDDRQTINAHFINTPLNKVLENALSGQAVNFVIDENAIVLNRKIKSEDQVLNLPDLELKGRVTDENGQPLASVTIRVATTISNSTRPSSAQLLYTATILTKSDGTFSFTAGPQSEFLIFSFVGYENKVVKIGDQRSFVVSLNVNKSPLDEIQVIAYGTTTKRFATGSIGTLKRTDIEKQPVSSPLQALEGRIPGVYISEASGISGSGISVQIRGANSLQAGRNPLYIIDGVPFTATPTETSSGTFQIPTPLLGGNGTFSPFDNIPTSDIESIEVLKDADATAIYGSRAANGVVMITTKKGKSGKMRINANIYSGVSKIARSMDMLNTEQYLKVRNQAFANDNITPTSTNAPDLSFGDGYTNFLQSVMGNTGHFTDGTLAVSGGNKQTQYLISGNYRHQSTVLPGNYADKKATVHFSIQSQSDNSKFSISLSGAYTKNNNNLPSANINSYYALPPNLPIYNADGTFFWIPSGAYTNPVAALKSPKSVVTDNIIGNATLKYNILPGLSFKTDVGFNRINFNAVTATLKANKNPFLASSATGSVALQENFNQVFNIEPQLSYTRKIGASKFDVLLGDTYQYSQFVQPFLINGSFTNDALYNDLGSTTIQLTSSGRTESKFTSLFGRVNYTLLDKYVLNFNGRRDGSSRFGPGNKFGNFGSVGAAWIFSEEKFFRNRLQWLSFGKIRGSYGTLGNDQLPEYQYLSLYSNGALAASYNGVNTLVPASFQNPKLGWEVTKKLEFTADLNFIKDRINLSASWYRNVSDHLLTYLPLATQTGFSGYNGNFPGTVENKGWEFSLETKNIQKKDFTWSTSLNLTIPKNKLASYPKLASSIYANSYVVGQSLSTVLAYHFTGFDHGVPQFEDMDGSKSISGGNYATTGKGDYIVAGNTDPKFYGGFNNSFSYKGFQLDFLFQFVKKDGYNIYNSTATPGSATNLPLDVLNLPFQYTTLATSAAGAGFTRYKISDAAFGDASFIRLKNVSLNYKFKDVVIKRIGLQSLNVYMHAQNLLTFTKYLGFDPETLGTYVPPTKLISFGLQTTF
ncbi:SusC/RagA family TonB-linked outer membrane protein [Pinibacter aurantiacus]|uniref:SusC/RagA family TonB-linked outer membrane protein n=1 Tax=Pinibacter aurantiacus TaxID=2851599 RepID=A0A9E2W7U6_9BACT|nr:SusC/RagA family TonB-linked outer membrane protein [Pinibacter aurantiacus]MBV4357286.1 SusC/RagA family TonB-linked outer membrane protein [Pinibacter aurantiacus]